MIPSLGKQELFALLFVSLLNVLLVLVYLVFLLAMLCDCGKAGTINRIIAQLIG